MDFTVKKLENILVMFNFTLTISKIVENRSYEVKFIMNGIKK